MKNAKTKVATATNDLKVALKNALRLIEAAALLVAAYYNYTLAYQAHSDFEVYIRVTASVVIGLRGAFEMLRYLAQQEGK